MSERKTAASATEAANTPGPKPRVRDRIFEAASDLFYRQGIRAVGIDAITSGADTNKMSFYRNFSSKDELVAEYLRAHVREYWDWWDGICAQHPEDPRQQVIDLFTAFRDEKCADEDRGCALGNAAVEICDDSHPGRSVITEYKHEKRERWRALARDMGAPDPDALGDALLMLQEGGHQTRLTFCGVEGPLSNIVDAAAMLVRCGMDPAR